MSLYEKLLARADGAMAEKPPRSSAAVIPWRRNAAKELEVFWVRRSPKLSFMGGWYAFPGGGLSRRDASIPVAGTPAGASSSRTTEAMPEIEGTASETLGPDLVPGLLACVVRELFEETGLLLTAGEAGDATRRRAARTRLLDREAPASFAEIVAENGWRLEASALVFAGRWLTPPVAPIRFDNRFFLLEWPSACAAQPEVWPGELAEGEWIAPGRALERWRRGEVMTAPPILHILRVLGEDGPEDGLPRLLDAREANLGPFRRVEFRPGVVLLPLRTPTLLPATHTNAFLLGRRDLVLIDPATPVASEIELLKRAVTAAVAGGQRIRAIWLTHHHADHVGAVEAMRSELGVPVCAHPHTAEILASRGIHVDRPLADGERVELGGPEPFSVRVCHTPGHARGHLAFFDETYGSLIAGDLMSTLSTIVIDPPDGDMDQYLASLERMIALEPRTLFPAHGPATLGAVEKLRQYVDHRLEREEQILAAWRAGLRSPEEMVGEIYADVPAAVHPVAERQILAHLERLRRRGRIPS